MPNARHSVYRVKNKYKTGYNPQTGEVELKVGEHIDNRGQSLPRPFMPGNPNLLMRIIKDWRVQIAHVMNF